MTRERETVVREGREKDVQVESVMRASKRWREVRSVRGGGVSHFELGKLH